MAKWTIEELTERILDGYRVTRENFDADLKELLLTCDVETMLDQAQRIERHFFQNEVDLCSIINGRSGLCSEDCKYCAQSHCHHTGCEEYGFLPTEEIYAAGKANQDAGVNRFAIVTAGRALKGRDFEKALEAYRVLHEKLHIGLCASMGLLDPDQFVRLREAGVTRYHCNLETSRENFPNICTTHTFDDKVRVIQAAQAAGLSVCSGGIIGLGESWEDRFRMSFSLSELGIRSIPINVLMPIPGTPLEHQPQISQEDAVRTYAIYRFLNPEADIRMAGGRGVLPESGATIIGRAASAYITGNMLTTAGATTIDKDKKVLARLGLTNRQGAATGGRF